MISKEEIAKSIDEGLKILKQEPSFIFNLEEIEAIQYLQIEIIDIQKDIDFYLDKENIIFKEELKAKQTILSLISKLQKELDKKDKVLKETFKYIDEHTYRDMEECEFGEAHNFICCKDCEKYIKEYFYKKVEEENDDINRNS